MAATQPIYKIIQSILAEGYVSQQARQTEDQLKIVKQIDTDKHLLADLLESVSQIEGFPEEVLAELHRATENKLNTLQLTQLYREINKVLLAIARKRLPQD